jgi:RNA-directed DNA polymerase
MAYWPQWRKPRTKVRSLMRLGVHVRSAVACGITSKGPWRSAKTPEIQQALSNAYLKSEGLISLMRCGDSEAQHNGTSHGLSWVVAMKR